MWVIESFLERLPIKGAIPIFVNLFDAMIYSQMQALIFPEKAKSLVAISKKKNYRSYLYQGLLGTHRQGKIKRWITTEKGSAFPSPKVKPVDASVLVDGVNLVNYFEVSEYNKLQKGINKLEKSNTVSMEFAELSSLYFLCKFMKKVVYRTKRECSLNCVTIIL